METPYFLIHEDALQANVQAFLDGFAAEYPNARLGYSVKTNSLPWLLRYMKARGALAEVVSDEEYHLAQLCGFQDPEIVFNGPIKTHAQLRSAVLGGAYVNLDSRSDLECLKAMDCGCAEHVGIRVNIPPEVFRREDIGYAEDGFRFGFSEASGDLEAAIQLVTQAVGPRFGLHLHCNSVTRSPEVYRAIAQYACTLIQKYRIAPSFIDIGGGFFGGVPGKTTPAEYLRIIRQTLSQAVDTDKTTLIVEPGSAIIGSVADLVTSVLDAKDTLHARIITTDGSRIHIDPLWAKKGYMHSIERAAKADRQVPRQVICGYTCMDHDRLMVLQDQPELNIGDKITYHRVGAYSMTFGGPFIRYYPPVYVAGADGEIRLVRRRITTEDYYRMHSADIEEIIK